MAQKTKVSDFGDKANDGYDRQRRVLTGEPGGDGGPEDPMPLFLRGEEEDAEPSSYGRALLDSRLFRGGVYAIFGAAAMVTVLLAGKPLVAFFNDKVAPRAAPDRPAQQLALANESEATIDNPKSWPGAARTPQQEAFAAAYDTARPGDIESQDAADAAPPARQVNPGEIAAMMNRARRLIAVGDIASARLLLTRAAEAQDPGAAFALAQTFDPQALGSRDARSVMADAAAARDWYQKAARLGSAEAQQRLAQMKN